MFESRALIGLLFDYFAIQKFTTSVYIASCSNHFGKLLILFVIIIDKYQNTVSKYWIYNSSGISEHAKLSKLSSANGLRINFLSPREEFSKMVKNISMHTQSLASVGIFVDYNCDSSVKFLDAVSIMMNLVKVLLFI